jgi:hypothetical protein
LIIAGWQGSNLDISPDDPISNGSIKKTLLALKMPHIPKHELVLYEDLVSFLRWLSRSSKSPVNKVLHQPGVCTGPHSRTTQSTKWIHSLCTTAIGR